MRTIRRTNAPTGSFMPSPKAALIILVMGFVVGTSIVGGLRAQAWQEADALKARLAAEAADRQAKAEARERLLPHIVAWEKQKNKKAEIAKTDDPFLRLKGAVQPNQTLSFALMAAGLEQGHADEILTALKGTLDFRRIQPKESFTAVYDPRVDRVEAFMYKKNRSVSYHLRREGDALVPYTVEPESTTVVVPVIGEVRSSLALAIQEVGETPALTEMVADVFAWDINFYSDSRKGDKFRLLVEKVISNGRTIKYGRLLAAEYQGYHTGPKYAFRYEMEQGKSKPTKIDYYDETGNSLRRSFLKVPLSTVRITSVFGFRLHPILKKRKPHHGVDLGAPRGTPIMSVADGTVIRAGYRGACGKEIFIQHSMGYRTRYCHLSRIAVKKGQRVTQKQFIGRVGSTGRSTGPHLHYELHYRGKPINPLKQKFNRGKPVPKKHKEEYLASAKNREKELFALGWPRYLGPEPPGDAYDGEALTPGPEPMELAAPLGEAEPATNE